MGICVEKAKTRLYKKTETERKKKTQHSFGKCKCLQAPSALWIGVRSKSGGYRVLSKIRCFSKYADNSPIMGFGSNTKILSASEQNNGKYYDSYLEVTRPTTLAPHTNNLQFYKNYHERYATRSFDVTPATAAVYDRYCSIVT